MIETGLFTYLANSPGVTAANEGRVYPLHKPQNDDQTCVVYRVISREFSRTFCGQPNITASRVQLDCWATSYSEAKALAKAVREALDFHKGDMGGVDVLSVQWQFENDDFESDTGFYRVVQDITIYHH